MKGASYPSVFLFMNLGGPPSQSGVVLERQEGSSAEWKSFNANIVESTRKTGWLI